MSTVLVVGAGPTGLTLAAELAGAGIRVLVLDKREERMPWSRAFGLMPRTMEMLDLRGQVEPFLDAGLPCSLPPVGDGKSHLDYSRLDTPFPYILILPQQRSEELLESWAVKAGADIRRGVEVTCVRQYPDHVEADLSDGSVERADFAVGCDGVHSVVRASAGIPFTGREYAQSLVIADVRLRRPPESDVWARIAPRGMVAIYPFGDGTSRLIVLDRERMAVPISTPVSVEELDESCLGITGREFGAHSPVWTSRFRSSQKHAQRYRSGRLLLAGDAAHTHIPSGGQGLQVGVQDALNLAWKLIAELEGWAPPGLLDTYDEERMPVAVDTLRKTDLAFRFETANSPAARLGRRLVNTAMSSKSLQVNVMREFAGLTLKYPRLRGDHRLVGRRIPDAPLHGGVPRGTRLYELFRDRRFVLLDQTIDGAVARDRGSARLTAVHSKAQGRPDWPELVLVRPDGYVAWAGDVAGKSSLDMRIRQWCG